jgi:hypothetical protein
LGEIFVSLSQEACCACQSCLSTSILRSISLSVLTPKLTRTARKD